MKHKTNCEFEERDAAVCNCTPEPTADWEEELRDYIDKTLKPKKPGMKNLDREIIIHRVRQLLAEEHDAQDGYCCACDYDIACLNKKIANERQAIREGIVKLSEENWSPNEMWFRNKFKDEIEILLDSRK